MMHVQAPSTYVRYIHNKTFDSRSLCFPNNVGAGRILIPDGNLRLGHPVNLDEENKKFQIEKKKNSLFVCLFNTVGHIYFFHAVMEEETTSII